MKRCILLVLGLIAALQSATQPTLGSIATLPGGTEEHAFVITYQMVLDAPAQVTNTARFKVTALIQGTLEFRKLGSSDAWVLISSYPFYLDNSPSTGVEIRWTPPSNVTGDQPAIYVYANDGVGDGGTHDSLAVAAVTVHLANTPDPVTATSGVNVRSGDIAPYTDPVVAVQEDAWNEFTATDLISLLQVGNPDDADLEFIVSDLGNGTLALSSGGAALARNAVVPLGVSLWWRPSANRFTALGDTPADDEAPVLVAKLKVRKTDHSSTTAAVALSSSIANVVDPFDTNATGTTAFTLVRGGAPLNLTVPEMIAHIQGHVNLDRTDSVGVDVTDTSFFVHSYHANGDWDQQTTFRADADETVRLELYTDVPSGTYVIGTWKACTPAGVNTDPHTTDQSLVIKVVSSSGGDSGSSGGGGGGGGCGAGTAMSILLFGGWTLALGRRNTRRM